jgi:copper chaperone CopZ
METSFTTPGITCGGCAGTIKRAVSVVPGVSVVAVDIAGRTVTVGHEERVSRSTLAAALKDAGYPPVEPSTGPDQAMHERHYAGGQTTAVTLHDPVCGMYIDPKDAVGTFDHGGEIYY